MVPPPLVTFREETAGPQTLAAIAEDRAAARHPYAYRGPESTKHYGDRISNAPGAVSPKTARALDDSPEITVTPHRPGQRTLALIEDDEGPEISVTSYRPGLKTFAVVEEELATADARLEVNAEPTSAAGERLNFHGLEIEQVHTFLVSCRVEFLRCELAQRRLVEARLLRKIPGLTLSHISHVEVEPAGEHRTLVQVFVREVD